MEMAQDRDRWRALVSTVMNVRVSKMRGISWPAAETVSFSRRTLLHGVSKKVSYSHELAIHSDHLPFWIYKVHCRFYNSPSPIRTQSHVNQVNTRISPRSVWILSSHICIDLRKWQAFSSFELLQLDFRGFTCLECVLSVPPIQSYFSIYPNLPFLLLLKLSVVMVVTTDCRNRLAYQN